MSRRPAGARHRWPRRPGGRGGAYPRAGRCRLRCRLTRDAAVAAPVLSPAQRRVRTVRRALAARGFHECVSFSFIARDQAKLFGGGDEARQLSNPIASDLDAMRPSLLPSLLARQRAMRRVDFQTCACLKSARLPERHAGAQTANAAGLTMGSGVRDWTNPAILPMPLTPRARCWPRWKRRWVRP
jgi:hypothetical protein